MGSDSIALSYLYAVIKKTFGSFFNRNLTFNPPSAMEQVKDKQQEKGTNAGTINQMEPTAKDGLLDQVDGRPSSPKSPETKSKPNEPSLSKSTSGKIEQREGYQLKDLYEDLRDAKKREANLAENMFFTKTLWESEKETRVHINSGKKEEIVASQTSYLPRHGSDIIPTPNTYSDNVYQLNNKLSRGKLLLINIKYFDDQIMPTRSGTNEDAANLTKLFLDLGFQVDRLDNPTEKQINAFMEEMVTEKNLQDYSVCAFAILTHGKDGSFHTKDGEMKIENLVKKFNLDYLAGKPKLFIVQACRGDVYMPRIRDEVDGAGRKETTQYNLNLPSEADFLYAFSTVAGYYSWRNSVNGSWFVQDLVKVFRKHAHEMDVARMLVKVSQLVAERLSYTREADSSDKKQIPSYTSQLRKDLFLFPPDGPLKVDGNKVSPFQ